MKEELLFNAAQIKHLKQLNKVGWGAVKKNEELEKLADVGIVTSEISPLDKKISVYRLTKKGYELAKTFFGDVK